MVERQRRPRGVLKVRRRATIGSLKRAKLMEKGLTDHAGIFSDPNPALVVFSNQIGKGMAAARDVQLALLIGMMTSELVYIQSVADTRNPDEAVAILLAGG